MAISSISAKLPSPPAVKVDVAAKAAQAAKAAEAKAAAAAAAQAAKAAQAQQVAAAKAAALQQAQAAKQLKAAQTAQAAAQKAAAAQAAQAAKAAQVAQAAATKAAAEAAAKAAKSTPKPIAPTPVKPVAPATPVAPVANVTPAAGTRVASTATVAPASSVVTPSVVEVKPVITPNAQPVAPAQSSKTEASGTSFTAGAGDVVVDIKNSDSGYNNKIYWSADNFKTKNYLGIDNNTGTYNIGKFAEGTKIDFGIDNGVGNFFRTGVAANNADNMEHAKATQTAQGTEIGFEDLYGGGDRDFNDAIINVKNLPSAKIETPVDTKVTPVVTPPKPEPTVDTKVTPLKPEPTVDTKVTPLKPEPTVDTKVAPPKPEPTVDTKVTPLKPEPTIETKVTPAVVPPKPESTEDDRSKRDTTNRSGLGDGTNPGQGGGRINATNQGASNPNSVLIAAPGVGPKLETQGTSDNANHSGLGDDSNPGKGAGTSNAVNSGTNNPNKASAYLMDPILLSKINTAA